jgi:uncharacterized membrane protein
VSLESGRKLGLIASIISIILPVAAIVGVVALILSIIATAATGIPTGTVSPNIFGLSYGLIGFLIALAIIGIVGFVMFMVAMYRLSHYYNEPGIFKNVLYAFILSLISAVVVLILQFTFIASIIASIPQTSTPATAASFTQFIVTYLVIIGVSIVFGIVNAVLYMRAFNKLAEKSGIDNFKTTGLLYLIGVLLTFVLIGGILVWIAWIFAAMGFHKLKPFPTATPTVSYPTQPPPSSTVQTKRCPNCGTENNADAIYCKNCGNTLK